ncbi:MAG: DUF1211 domain-containing protein [Acidimicrobiia bacterium]|nr:DUF1211 domain-containing protein [Acidimicrobiia bacterium]
MATPAAVARSYDRDSIEFGRIANLSDGVFAIALTLLVLNLIAPGVPADELSSMWRDLVPSLIAFALAFGLVANIWWLHHKVFATLDRIEAGMIAINIVGLAGVVLVPLPTSLVGEHPDERAAVLPFLGLFLVLSAVWLLFVVRANQVNAWGRPLPASTFRWLVVDWGVSLIAVVLAIVVALVSPVAALVVLPIASGLATVGSSRSGPERSDWF